MNYGAFCCYKERISSLTKREIENPFLVIDEICKKRTSADFQKDLWNFFWTIFKENEWMKYDPCYLYDTHIDLIRLIDVLWLLNKYSDKLSITDPVLKKDMERQRPIHDLWLVFQNMHRKNASKVQKLKSGKNPILYDFYKQTSLYSIKINICNYLQMGLDASYMIKNKYDYFVLQEYDVISDFLSIGNLINETYRIYQQGNAIFPRLESCKETMFAIDIDHPTHLSFEVIKNPSSFIEVFYGYCISINHIHNGLSAWESMLYEKDIWKKNGNPGNLLYFHDCLISFIDSIWLQFKFGKLEINNKKYNNKKIAAKNCNKEELKHPLIVVQSFFELKKLYEWKKQLEEWTAYSLSDTDEYPIEKREETAVNFKYLTKLIEVAYL